MRLSEILTRCRDLLQDSPTNTGNRSWSDGELARLLTDQINWLFRWQCEADPSYHNFEFDLLAADAVLLHTDEFVWNLPRWVHRITAVREKKESGSLLGTAIGVSDLRTKRYGWCFDRHKRFNLRGFSSAKDLSLYVAKTPARVHLGTTAEIGTATTLNLQQATAAFAYEQENEPDAYANAIVELTGVASAGRDPVGQVRRVTGSSRIEPTAASFRVQISVEPDWDTIPAISDTYEFHPEVDDAFIRLLVLRTARAAWEKHQNREALMSIRDDLSLEERRFIDSIKEREDFEPGQWQTEDAHMGSIDPDKHWALYGDVYG